MDEFIDGLLISVVGMAAVFVILILIMFIMVGIERLYRGMDVGEEELDVVDEIPLGGIPVGDIEGPEDDIEVAAVAIALATYLSEHGEEFGNRPIVIGGIQYQVEVGDISSPPVYVVINGEGYWAAVGADGLPFTRGFIPLRIEESKEADYGRGWRSAQPLSQGEYWYRHGWSRKT